MNTVDVVRFGHLTLVGTLHQVPRDVVSEPGACGTWSVKDIVAHLGSYELVFVDILRDALDAGAAPTLDRYREKGPQFNDLEVEARRGQTFDAVLDELNDAHARARELLDAFEPDRLRMPGTIAWYGPEYSLNDLIVYMYYGHKREHAAQIEAFHDLATRNR